MDAQVAGFVSAVRSNENENTQRQAPVISGQIGNDAVIEYFTVSPFATAEEHKQANKVDRQPPSKLGEIEKRPGPASGGDWFILPDVIHT